MKGKITMLSVLVMIIFALQMAYGAPSVTATYWEVEGGYRLDFVVTAGQYVVSSWGALDVVGHDLASP